MRSMWNGVFLSRRILRQSKLRLLECLEAICLPELMNLPHGPTDSKHMLSLPYQALPLAVGSGYSAFV